MQLLQSNKLAESFQLSPKELPPKEPYRPPVSCTTDLPAAADSEAQHSCTSPAIASAALGWRGAQGGTLIHDTIHHRSGQASTLTTPGFASSHCIPTMVAIDPLRGPSACGNLPRHKTKNVAALL